MILYFLFQLAYANKADELRELQLKNELINLNSTGYFYYTMEFPRPYDVVIYLVAPNCKLCSELLEEYKKVARFYKESGALHATKDENPNKRAVFFATMSYSDTNKQVFDQLGFSSAPNIFVSQPHIVFVPQEERERYLRDMKWAISYTDGTVTAHKFLEFINKRTGRQIQYKATTVEALTVIGVLLGTLSTLAILFVVLRPVFLSPKLWFAGSIVIYAVCLAGVVYNIIHNVPMFTNDKKGGFQWKTSGGRQQLGFEGIFMSLSITFSGLIIVSIIKLSNLTERKAISPVVIRVLYFVLFILLHLLISFVEQTYREKSYYNPVYWPPRTYVKGPLMRDQGNSI